MPKSVDKPRLRNALKKLRRIPFDREDPFNLATAPLEMLEFLAMIAGLKPVVLIGRGFDDKDWINGVQRIAEDMRLHVMEGPKWEAISVFSGLPEWYAEIDQNKNSEDPVVYICKSKSLSAFVRGIADKGGITIEEESSLLGYPKCCVHDHYYRVGRMNKGFTLMLERLSNGDELEMMRLVRDDVPMSPKTDEEVECMREASRTIVAPYTSIVMCPSCEKFQDSPARKVSKRYKLFADSIDPRLAMDIDLYHKV